MHEFNKGDYVVYINGSTCELGRVSSVTDAGAFVCYTDGETASLTPHDLLYPISNASSIKRCTLGGDKFLIKIKIEYDRVSNKQEVNDVN